MAIIEPFHEFCFRDGLWNFGCIYGLYALDLDEYTDKISKTIHEKFRLNICSTWS